MNCTRQPCLNLLPNVFLVLQFDRDAIVLDTGKQFKHRRQTFNNLHLGSIVIKCTLFECCILSGQKLFLKITKFSIIMNFFGVFFISRWLSDCIKLTVIDSQTNSNYWLLRNKIFTEKTKQIWNQE